MISEDAGGGTFTSKYVTGAQLGGGGGTVTSVAVTTGTSGTDIAVSGSPITTSGTITINIPTASATNTGKLSNTDFSRFDAKQTLLVSGSNIKTINSTSLLGSGNIDLTKTDVGLSNVDNTSDLNKPISTATQTALNAKQPTLISGTNIKTINSSSLLGSGDITTPVGIHAPRIPASGGYVNPLLTAVKPNLGVLQIANQLRCFPFYPMKTFSIVSASINVTAAVASSNARILFYDDSNGIPNAKLYESTNLDTSTTGVKTYTSSFTFNAGITYWICIQTSAAVTLSGFQGDGGSFTFQTAVIGTSVANCANYTYAIGSAPSTLGTTGISYGLLNTTAFQFIV